MPTEPNQQEPSVSQDSAPDILSELLPAPSQESSKVEPPRPSVRGTDTIFVLLSIVAGDILLYRAPGMTGYALLLLALLAGLLVSRTDAKFTLNMALLLFFIPLLILRCIWQAGFWSVLWPVVLIAAFATIQRTAVTHALEASVHGMISLAFGFVPLLQHLRNATLRAGGSLLKKRRAGELRLDIALGAIITAGIFGAIFTVANPIFERLLDRIFRDFFHYFDFLLPSPTRILLWLLVGVCAAGLASPVLSRFRFQFAEDDLDSAPSPLPFTGSIGSVALGVLFGANLIFLLNNALDTVYLWGEARPPSGISFSDFARRGAGWLTFALFLSTVLIGVSTCRSALLSKQSRWIRRLSFLWIAQDIFLAVGVYRRIGLYVGFNGLTPMRILGIWGTTAVAAALLVMAVKIHREKNLVWLLRQFAVVFIAGMTLYAAFPDQLACARFNADQALNGNIRPLVWLFEQDITAEGSSALVPLLHHPDPVVARGVSAILADRLSTCEKSRNENWRKFQASSEAAFATLDPLRPGLIPDSSAREALRSAVWIYRNHSFYY